LRPNRRVSRWRNTSRWCSPLVGSFANRRHLEIARGLALRPRLLLLDEPTAGMNPTETDEILEQLLELHAQKQTILLVEHKLDLVMKVSDYVLVMDSGQLIAQGTPGVVRNDERVIEAYGGTLHEQRLTKYETIQTSKGKQGQ
jgi:branched-chain amino acid transport system ATP-binding protein